MSTPSRLPGGTDLPPGIEPWCTTLRGEQAWRLEVGGGELALGTWQALRQRHPRQERAHNRRHARVNQML